MHRIYSSPTLYLLAILNAGLGLLFGAEPPQQPLPTTSEQAINVRLAPQVTPPSQPAPARALTDQMRKLLTASSWRFQGAMNIMGGGIDTILDFAWTDGAGLTVTRTVLAVGRWPLRPADSPKARTDGPYSCEIRGQLLCFNNQQQTFFISTNPPGLILSAVVRLKDGRWYCALPARQTGDARKPRSNEYLFEFSDNPLTRDRGTGKVQAVLENETVTVKCVSFDRSSQDGWMRVKSEGAGTNRFEWAYIQFAPDNSYGLIQDQDHINSKAFTPVPKQH